MSSRTSPASATFSESPRKPSSAWLTPATNAWCCCSGARRPRALLQPRARQAGGPAAPGVGDVPLQTLAVTAQRERAAQPEDRNQQHRPEDAAPEQLPVDRYERRRRDANEPDVLPRDLPAGAASPAEDRIAGHGVARHLHGDGIRRGDRVPSAGRVEVGHLDRRNDVRSGGARNEDVLVALEAADPCRAGVQFVAHLRGIDVEVGRKRHRRIGQRTQVAGATYPRDGTSAPRSSPPPPHRATPSRPGCRPTR